MGTREAARRALRLFRGTRALVKSVNTIINKCCETAAPVAAFFSGGEGDDYPKKVFRPNSEFVGAIRAGEVAKVKESYRSPVESILGVRHPIGHT